MIESELMYFARCFSNDCFWVVYCEMRLSFASAMCSRCTESWFHQANSWQEPSNRRLLSEHTDRSARSWDAPRWDSEFIALSRLYEEKEALTAAASTLGETCPMFADEQWDMVAQLLLTLNHVRHLSVQLQARNITYSDAVVMILTLRDSSWIWSSSYAPSPW